MQKALIAPIVAMIALIIQVVFGIKLDESQIDIITNGLVAVALAVVAVVTYVETKKKP